MNKSQRHPPKPKFRLTDRGREKADSVFQAARAAGVAIEDLWMDSRADDFIRVLRSTPGAVQTWDPRELDALRMIMRLRAWELT